MKIRDGFVSNSSSSSFCIWGAYIEDPEDVYAILRKKFKENFQDKDMRALRKKLCEEHPGDDKDTQYSIAWDEVEFSELMDEIGVFWSSNDDGWWVGQEWCDIGDDETGRQFKERVDAQLQKYGLLADNDICETFNESVYN
jgi:hypothetical protein